MEKAMKEDAGYWSRYLPWQYISSTYAGVVVQKDGLLQRTYAFRGPDLEASAAFYVHDLSLFLSNSVKRLGAGWMIQTEVQRFCTQEYPGSEFEF